ncbi:hypothetical protein HDU76_004074, partial [Blyttiomyces sp. JEL0837]
QERKKLAFNFRAFVNGKKIKQRGQGTQGGGQLSRPTFLSNATHESAWKRIEKRAKEIQSEIRDNKFKPPKYTEPRGLRTYTLLPHHGDTVRYLNLSPKTLLKCLQVSGVEPNDVFGTAKWPTTRPRRRLSKLPPPPPSKSRKDKDSYLVGFSTDGRGCSFLVETWYNQPTTSQSQPFLIKNIRDDDNVEYCDPGKTDIVVSVNPAVLRTASKLLRRDKTEQEPWWNESLKVDEKLPVFEPVKISNKSWHEGQAIICTPTSGGGGF